MNPLFKENHQKLQQLMKSVGITSLQELSSRSGVSQWQLNRLQHGLIPKMSVDIVLKLAQTLQVSIYDLLNDFSTDLPIPVVQAPQLIREDSAALANLKAEYQKLQQQMATQRETFTQEVERLQKIMEQQRETLNREFQRASLEILESWLLQWPTAAVAAQKNPKLAAIKLLPLIKPVATLLKQWGVEAIAAVGEHLSYNPQYHELMNGTAEIGSPVVVRYVGYRQGDNLLYRAKVSPVSAAVSSESTNSVSSPPTVFDPPEQPVSVRVSEHT